MEESVSVRFSKRNRNTLIAKIILIFTISCLCGFAIWKDSMQSFQAGQKTGQFQKMLEKIETKQTNQPAEPDDPGPVALYIILMNICFFFFFGIYELIGYGLGALITLISTKLKTPPLNT